MSPLPYAALSATPVPGESLHTPRRSNHSLFSFRNRHLGMLNKYHRLRFSWALSRTATSTSPPSLDLFVHPPGVTCSRSCDVTISLPGNYERWQEHPRRLLKHTLSRLRLAYAVGLGGWRCRGSFTHTIGLSLNAPPPLRFPSPSPFALATHSHPATLPFFLNHLGLFLSSARTPVDP